MLWYKPEVWMWDNLRMNGAIIWAIVPANKSLSCSTKSQDGISILFPEALVFCYLTTSLGMAVRLFHMRSSEGLEGYRYSWWHSTCWDGNRQGEMVEKLGEYQCSRCNWYLRAHHPLILLHLQSNTCNNTVSWRMSIPLYSLHKSQLTKHLLVTIGWGKVP